MRNHEIEIDVDLSWISLGVPIEVWPGTKFVTGVRGHRSRASTSSESGSTSCIKRASGSSASSSMCGTSSVNENLAEFAEKLAPEAPLNFLDGDELPSSPLRFIDGFVRASERADGWQASSLSH